MCKKTDISVCASQGPCVNYGFWPGAEDKALRGRNLSAVSRTLYRQVGEASLGLPSCIAQTWRVENQSDKSTVRITRNVRFSQHAQKTTFSIKPKSIIKKQSQLTVHFFGASPQHVAISPKPFHCLLQGFQGCVSYCSACRSGP